MQVKPEPDPAAAVDADDPLDEEARALAVALMRTFRLMKRLHAQADDPVLLWVLHVVSQNQPIRLSDLASYLHLDVSTASRHVSALESLGRLSREPDPADRRASRISLTGEGSAELQRKFAERCRRIADVVADWADSDVRIFEQMLKRLADDLEAHDPGLSDPQYGATRRESGNPKENAV